MPQRTSGPIILFKCRELRSKEGKMPVKVIEQDGGREGSAYQCPRPELLLFHRSVSNTGNSLCRHIYMLISVCQMQAEFVLQMQRSRNL